MIQNIEELAPILQTEAFVDGEVLEYREIQVPNRRSNHHIAPGITFEANRRQRKRCRVEPMVHRRVVDIAKPGFDGVDALRHKRPAVADIRAGGSEGNPLSKPAIL